MISRFFIDHPVFANVIALITILLGVVALRQLPIEQYPAITPPTVQVRAVYPGANAQTVATTIEEQVNGVERMLYLSSNASADGSSTLTITFDIGTDLDKGQVLVQNRVSAAEPLLPEEVRRQGVTVKKQSTDIILLISLISPGGEYDSLFMANYAECARQSWRAVLVPAGFSGFGLRQRLQPIRQDVSGARPGRRHLPLPARRHPAPGSTQPGGADGAAGDPADRETHLWPAGGDEIQPLPADRRLPRTMGHDWTGIAFQERLVGGQALWVFAMAVVLVYLVLAAQYESWLLPLAVPLGMLGAVAVTAGRGMAKKRLHADRIRADHRAGQQERDPYCGVCPRPAPRGATHPRIGGGGGPAALSADPDDLVRIHPRRGAPRVGHRCRGGKPAVAGHGGLRRHDQLDGSGGVRRAGVLRSHPGADRVALRPAATAPVVARGADADRRLAASRIADHTCIRDTVSTARLSRSASDGDSKPSLTLWL
jgi:hypothetical protein